MTPQTKTFILELESVISLAKKFGIERWEMENSLGMDKSKTARHGGGDIRSVNEIATFKMRYYYLTDGDNGETQVSTE